MHARILLVSFIYLFQGIKLTWGSKPDLDYGTPSGPNLTWSRSTSAVATVALGDGGAGSGKAGRDTGSDRGRRCTGSSGGRGWGRAGSSSRSIRFCGVEVVAWWAGK